jgi:hypothetical protein
MVLSRSVRGVNGSIRLSDLDQVAFRIAEVAAGFRPAVDWRREELGASLAPRLVGRLDVCDADVEEAADAIGIAGRLEGDGWLVVCGSAADVDDDPAVRERDDRRLAGENDLAAEDVAVEVGGAFDVLGDDEVRERDSVVQRRKLPSSCSPWCRWLFGLQGEGQPGFGMGWE